MKHFLFPILALAAIAACSSSSTNPTPVGALPDGGETDSAIADASVGTQCSTARDQLLLPIDKTSTGVVTVLSDTAGTRDRKSTRLNSSHSTLSRMPSSA